ncbi:MAG: NADH-quinone oxidoreductase subunit [Thermodesulfobacteriota bacterium]|nr:NADH-quinone oxidoreductase subunit [Thermodesulfobacteriota bacterium]
MNQDRIREKLTEKFGSDILRFDSTFEGISVGVPPEKVLDVCHYLRDEAELKFDFLSFVAGIDHYPAQPRFEVVYQLYSVKNVQRMRLKAKIEDQDGHQPSIQSVTEIWRTADWHERETAEMFGIKFLNHPDPRKLLLPDEWQAHPLRKDFPLEGTEEDTPDLPS